MAASAVLRRRPTPIARGAWQLATVAAPQVVPSWTSSSARLQRRGQHTLSTDRLQEFIHAELSYFAQRKIEPLSLGDIVQASTPRKVATLVQGQLPYFFAKRVKHVERLEGWEKHPELARIREIFMESFRQLRLTETNLDNPRRLDLADYNQVIYGVRKRHKPVTALLGEAIRKLSENDPDNESFFQSWADTFLMHRISTEMLTSHYVAIIEATEAAHASDSCVGIVDTKCNPSKICQEAADQVLEKFPGIQIVVQANNCTESQTEIEFSYISMYLRYIVHELLWNSARATTKAASEGAQGVPRSPIIVTVCADQKQVAIRISDQGRGVQFDEHSRIWSYFFSTSNQSFEVYEERASPLSGRGMGLPLGRLYAKYLGGNLELMNMPGIGVDAYLFLNRISLGDGSSLFEPGLAESRVLG